MKRLHGARALAAVGLVLALQAPGAAAADRRLSVQLALIAGDARMLVDPATPPRRREELSARIRSSLGSIGMTVRYAAETAGHADADLPAETRTLRTLFAARNLIAFLRLANRLATTYPVDTSYFEPLAVTPSRLETGRSIYRQYCLGCHTGTDSGAGVPALDLFAMAHTAPRNEFFARLLGGIYGDRTTSLANPFTDEALASLAAYFINGDPGAAEK